MLTVYIRSLIWHGVCYEKLTVRQSCGNVRSIGPYNLAGLGIDFIGYRARASILLSRRSVSRVHLLGRPGQSTALNGKRSQLSYDAVVSFASVVRRGIRHSSNVEQVL